MEEIEMKGSRKIIFLGTIWAVTAFLTYLGKVDSQGFIWVTSTVAGGFAVGNAAEHLGSLKGKK